MSESLSQEEIDAMLNGGTTSQTDENTSSLTEQDKFDIIGEVGNISMSQAATTLSSILNRRVMITTPRVTKVRFGEILEEMAAPKVSTTVEFKEGLFGTNLMLLEVSDAIIIADLMMGGEGAPTNTKFTELELSAVAEAMNQMIGSASTSMATMINKKVDILPPVVNLWESKESIDYEGIVMDEEIYRISFSLNVEGVIESEIMQVFTEEVVNEITDAMLSDKAVSVRREEPVVPQEPVQPTPPVAEPQMQQAPQQAQPREQQWQQPQQPVQSQQRTVEVSQAEFQPLFSKTTTPEYDNDNLGLIMDVPLDMSVILGRSRKSIKDILSLNTGSVVELDKLTDEPLEILVNGKLIATGEVVVINENFGVRITNILSPKQRLNNLN
ncbi:flagellar motor switch phosphatase FliY [Enterococcus saccharolyticus]|uniref:flagellar motor switch phosphatase FliY n=1 Tax=Enterococcus TaxID=1350 RepID=UPI001E3EC979|nr:flagellar motor switch phosphatase FliY [Enterococcus saccharolyticus]MCD5002856.1 flagellar motor switch phosphatase FliY [Enterococcus saccharolyticus]